VIVYFVIVSIVFVSVCLMFIEELEHMSIQTYLFRAGAIALLWPVSTITAVVLWYLQ